MPAAMTLRDVIGHGQCGPAHLICQCILFLGWQLLDKAVNLLPEFPRPAIQLEVVQSKASLFHCHHPPVTLTAHPSHHSPLTPHHSPLTTHHLEIPRIARRPAAIHCEDVTGHVTI